MKQKTGDRWVIDKTSITINFASYCKSNRTDIADYGCPYAMDNVSIRVELVVHRLCTVSTCSLYNANIGLF